MLSSSSDTNGRMALLGSHSKTVRSIDKRDLRKHQVWIARVAASAKTSSIQALMLLPAFVAARKI